MHSGALKLSRYALGMLLRGIMSLPTSYAIFTGKFAGVRALERHECGTLSASPPSAINFQPIFQGVWRFFFDRLLQNRPQKRRIRPHLAPEPRAFGAREPGT